MTGKRFIFVAFDGFEDNGEYITPYQVVDLLNELHEENQSLKVQLHECANNKLYTRRQLEKENETLKKQVEIFHNNALHNYKQIKHIETTLDNAIENERTELGRSVLKQFKESI